MTKAGATPTGGRVVVLGGGIAGLASAIALAGHGRTVTLIERDPPPPGGGQDPFLAWKRRGVPQFRLPHGFSARARSLLAAHAPDVLERLRADGIEEINVFKQLISPELWQPADDEFTVVWARRSAFELALRRSAEAQPGIRFLCPAVASGLNFAPAGDGPPRVTGVRLADGRELAADLVLDCGGRRSPVPRWLAAEKAYVHTDLQDCQTVYFSRYYRFTPRCELPKTSVAVLRGDLESMMYIGFPGDHDTFAICMEVRPDDRDMRLLRHTWAFEAVARSIPDVASWVDPANATPLADVQLMGGHHNVRRRYVADGRPVVLGLLAAGDALCTTNPAYGWGASMALTYAFAAARAAVEHASDPVAMALAYDAATAAEADAVYRESAAMDRARIYRDTGQEVPEHDRAEMERQRVIAEGLAAGVFFDLELGRAFCRRVNLAGPADEVLDNPDFVAGARKARERLTTAPRPAPGPTRRELNAILHAARPRSTA
ncbi:FAD-binding monooxygenase [Microtetraspora sp. NBRC 13810]|uniref:FAD-dependent oxidoreductase n=1 Tax=Microtetraspora sp. NBRC 13810 TaxID=3030990 RepID=UPI00249F9581|nr:FAD-dependent oxidoreductase [Microtetraspora sp. NBRC 13810]GLW06787.1 FAD-binding monooxygenase [Microtetraspora sp. NBRC 13810]